MTTQSLVLLALLALACGRESGGKLNKDQPTDGDNPTEEEEKKAAAMRTLALDSKDDLPGCTDVNNHQLAYVISEEQFYTCKDASWTAIDVVEPGLQDNEWYDRQTGWIWQVSAAVSWPAAYDCGGGSVVPTEAEIKAAILGGMTVFDVPVTLWVPDASTDRYINSSGVNVPEEGSSKHSSACVFK